MWYCCLHLISTIAFSAVSIFLYHEVAQRCTQHLEPSGQLQQAVDQKNKEWGFPQEGVFLESSDSVCKSLVEDTFFTCTNPHPKLLAYLHWQWLISAPTPPFLPAPLKKKKNGCRTCLRTVGSALSHDGCQLTWLDDSWFTFKVQNNAVFTNPLIEYSSSNSDKHKHS